MSPCFSKLLVLQYLIDFSHLSYLVLLCMLDDICTRLWFLLFNWMSWLEFWEIFCVLNCYVFVLLNESIGILMFRIPNRPFLSIENYLFVLVFETFDFSLLVGMCIHELGLDKVYISETLFNFIFMSFFLVRFILFFVYNSLFGFSLLYMLLLTCFFLSGRHVKVILNMLLSWYLQLPNFNLGVNVLDLTFNLNK